MTTQLKEYVKHIQHTHAAKQKTAWCGETLQTWDWCFQDLDHAAYNALNEGRLLTCKKCVEEAVKALKKGEDDGSPEQGADEDDA